MWPHHGTFIRGMVIIALLMSSAMAATDDTAPNTTSPEFVSVNAELVRVGSDRLYFWVAATDRINTDFRAVVTADSGSPIDCAITTTIAQMAVSEQLPEAMISRLKSSQNIECRIYFDLGMMADTLRVGIPSILSYDFGCEKLPWDWTLPVNRVCKYYDDLKEAEIDLAIGAIDLLLLPAPEVSADARCLYKTIATGSYVEWCLVADLPPEDLTSAALNFALKGALTTDTTLPQSLLLESRHIKTIFPRNPARARDLFDGMKRDQTVCRVNFPTPLMFPSILSALEKQVQSCGGRLVADSDHREIACRLFVEPPEAGKQFVTVEELLSRGCRMGSDPYRDSVPFMQFTELLKLAGESESRRLRWTAGMSDSCSRPPAYFHCFESLSKRLSENCWLIPLGRTELVALTRNDVHDFAENKGRLALKHFYRVRKP